MPSLLLCLLTLGALPQAVTSEVSADVVDDAALRQASWSMSVHAGGGRVAEDGVVLIRPRVAVTGSVGIAALSVPLWLRIADQPPTVGTTEIWFNAWDRAETYLGFVEELRAHIGSFELQAGPLRQQTLGLSAMVDDFDGSIDPVSPRVGARVSVANDLVEVVALVDGLTKPHLVAAQVQIAPLALVDRDPRRRLRLSAVGAVDPTAPGTRGTDVTGGGAFGAAFLIWRGEVAAVDAYGVGALLSTPGSGAHIGIRLELVQSAEPSANGLSLRLEALVAGRGYTPYYFDRAYQAERYEVAAFGHRPKATLRPPAGVGIGGRLDTRLGPVRAGFSVHTLFQGWVHGSAFVGIDYRRLRLAASLSKRHLAAARDFVRFDDRTDATLEAAVRLWFGAFAFCSMHHGWRRRGESSKSENTWMLGLGYALEDVI